MTAILMRLHRPHAARHRAWPPMRRRQLVSTLLCCPLADAETPAFDRHGIAFATLVLSAGSFDWQQGMADFQLDNAEGVRSATYTADSVLRVGMTAHLEVQIGGSAWNRRDLRSAGMASHSIGAGDSSIALKWAPSLSFTQVTLALLGKVTLPPDRRPSATGSRSFHSPRPSPATSVMAVRSRCTRTSITAAARRHGRCRRISVSRSVETLAAISKPATASVAAHRVPAPAAG